MALLVVAPFFIFSGHFPIASFYGEFSAAVVFSLLVFFVLSIGRVLQFPCIALVPLLFCLVNWHYRFRLEALYSGQHTLWLQVLGLVVLVLVAFATLKEEVGRERLVVTSAIALLVATVGSVLLSLAQIARIDLPGLMSGEPDYFYANIGQRNHYGDLMALGLASLLYLLVRFPERGSLKYFLPLVGLGLGLSSSRSIWLYLGLLGFLAWRLRKYEPESYRLIWRYWLAAVVLFVAAESVLPYWISNYEAPTARIATQMVAGGELRLAIWSEAVKIIAENPWSGVGYQNGPFWHFLMQAKDHNPLFRSQYDGLYLENYHNLILQLGVEFGIGGLFFGLCLAFFVIRACWRVNDSHGWLAASLMGIIFIHAMLEYPLHYVNFLLLFVVLMALNEEKHWTVRVPPVMSKSLAVLVLCAGVWVLWPLWQGYQAIERATNLARLEGMKIGVIRDDLRKASTVSALEPYVDAVLATIPLKDLEPEARPFALKASERAMRFRTSVVTVKAHIDRLEEMGFTDEAAALRDKARRAYQSFKG